MEFNDKKILVKEHDFLIVPKGVKPRPFADNEVAVLLFEPVTTLNTGEIKNERTNENLEKI